MAPMKIFMTVLKDLYINFSSPVSEAFCQNLINDKSYHASSVGSS